MEPDDVVNLMKRLAINTPSDLDVYAKLSYVS